MKNGKKALPLYLDQYAEPEVKLLDSFPDEYKFNHSLVIPAYKESKQFLQRLLAQPFSSCLFVIVINQPDDCNEDSELNNADGLNTSLADYIDTQHTHIWRNKNIALYNSRQNNSILVIDRFSQRPIPKKQGVGLARKIGCDLAVALTQSGHLKTKFIHSSDADTHLPDDYFAQTTAINNTSAAVYNFTHDCADDDVGNATALYEASINYYLAGLTWAGSGYAFPTIGSCLAISSEHYCAVRGFPKRAGGEDFYLLNKLAKIAPIVRTHGDALHIRARASDRVPFGTGPAVAKIMALPCPMEFMDYDPRVFTELKNLLEAFESIPEAVKNRTTPEWLSGVSRNNISALTSLEFASLLNHLVSQTKSESQCLRHIHTWFDGFRTLKYIHHLEKQAYPKVPHHLALTEFNKLTQKSG